MNLGRWRILAAAGAAFALLTAAGRLSAQGTITGKVTARGSSQPLAETRVLVIGTTITATTGEDGKYTLRNIPAGTAQLQVLRVGYQSTKKNVNVATGSTTNADFELGIAVAQLEEVVTTATGQQRKVELGNAVSTLGDVGKRVEETKINSVADLLTAKSPGVIVLPASTLGGAPSLRIRGSSSISLGNSPIYYVDGVRFAADNMTSGTDTRFSLLNALNPDDIEDIEIVKGPSAATLYGTNAANGVVVITTKKGRAGSTKWNWTAEGGLVDDRTPWQPMYANFGHAPGAAAGSPSIRCLLPTMSTSKFTGNCVTDSITSYNYMTDPENTFVHMGHRSLLGMNVNGGNEALRYFVSGDIDNETGPIQMQNFYVQRFDSLHVPVRDEWFHPEAQQRGSIRANLSAALSPKVDLNFSSGFTKMDNRIPPESDLIIALYYTGMQNYGYKGCPSGQFPCGLDKDPFQSDGVPLHDALQWSPGDIMQVTQMNDVQRMTSSADMSWRPFSWMVNQGTAGLDLAAVNFFQLCRLTECPPQSSTAKLGRVTDNQNKIRNFSAKLASTSTWNARTWMNLKTSVGGDYTNIEVDSALTNGTILPPGASTVTAASTRIGTDRQPTAVKTLGLYVQEQLGLRDRLFLTGAVRTDQNSAFGTNFQQVYYPKLSISWIASDEDFFPKYSWLDQFRFRSAYGASGVQPGATAGLAIFAPSSVSIPSRSSTSGTDTPALSESQLANPNLKPEKSAELELGFESQMLHNRLHVDYTFYNKKTHDALVQVALAPSSAAAQLTPLINIGSTQNYGHEVQVNAQLVDGRNFGWDILLSGSHNTNKVLDLGIDPNTKKARILGTGGTTQQRVGYPLNSQWYRPYTYSDDNGDGVLQVGEVHVSPDSLVYMGYNTPRDIFSVQSGFDLLGRRLRINTLFDYKGGGNEQDGANNFQCNTAPNSCYEDEVPTAPLAQQARVIAKSYGSRVNGSTFKSSGGYFISDQFWRWREASAAVQLPSAINRRLRSQSGSTIVFAARNLHLWTSFTGIDPEANYGLAQSDNQNEFQTAAAPTYFTLRLNLKY
jgi:TonB-linked SusC/RagA family outer membrane protein